MNKTKIIKFIIYAVLGGLWGTVFGLAAGYAFNFGWVGFVVCAISLILISQVLGRFVMRPLLQYLK